MSTRHLALETGDSSHDDEWQDNQNGRDSSDDEGGDTSATNDMSEELFAVTKCTDEELNYFAGCLAR